jgi:hypothetical protein
VHCYALLLLISKYIYCCNRIFEQWKLKSLFFPSRNSRIHNVRNTEVQKRILWRKIFCHLYLSKCVPIRFLHITYVFVVIHRKITENHIAVLACVPWSLCSENRIEYTGYGNFLCISDRVRFSLYVKIRSQNIGFCSGHTLPLPNPTSYSGIT